MLVRLAAHLAPAARREFVAKRRLEIAQRHATAGPVQRGGKCSHNLRQSIAHLAREKRNDFRGDLESEPLKTVTNSFPGCAHRASVSTLPVRREWGRCLRGGRSMTPDPGYIRAVAARRSSGIIKHVPRVNEMGCRGSI